MSLDLFERETEEHLSRLPRTMRPEAGGFEGFARGLGTSAMQTFAKAGRAASMAALAPVVAVDRFTNGTEISDRLFRWHDDVFGSAVDYWTAKPEDVNVAGQIVGQLLATLPMVIASPAATVGMTGMATAEDLTRLGVSPDKAIAAGAAQAAGLGLGIWMPIMGQTLAQRVLVGGAGFNLAQGVVTRGASEMILEDTKAAEMFKAIDPTAMTLDVLLGMAFGSLAHLSPAQRAQGAEVWTKLRSWAETASPSTVDSIITLRTAQHLNVDSAPGRLAEPVDQQAHYERVKTAMEQMARGEPVDVDGLPPVKAEPDTVRWQDATARAEALRSEAETIAKEHGFTGEDPEVLTRTEGPPASRQAESPPPRGEVGKPGGPEAVDPVALEADRAIEARPDWNVRLGEDANGGPVAVPVKKYIEKVRADVQQARNDANLFDVAAACMLGVA